MQAHRNAAVALLAALTVVIYSAFALTASLAQAAQTPDQILSALAAQQTHSWVDNPLGYDALEAKYKAGGRLYVTCGFVSEVARRLLVEAGYHARVVGAVTLEPYDRMNDGHAMVEVWQNQRWELYDVDSNAKAVDANGNGVGVVDQVAAVQAGTAHWQDIATDPLWFTDEPDADLRALAESAFSDLVATHKRLLGVALLPRDPSGVGGYMLFHDAGQAQRLADYVGAVYRLTTDEQWDALRTSLPQAPPAPAPASVPAPPPAVVASPIEQPVAPTPVDPSPAPAAVDPPVAAPATVATPTVTTTPAATPARRVVHHKHRHHRRRHRCVRKHRARHAGCRARRSRP